MEKMKNSLKETENYVNTEEVEEVKELLQKYDIVLKDNIDENDLILKYETFYDQLNEFVIKKRKEIVNVEEMVNAFSEFSCDNNFKTIVNKKKYSTNKIIDCNNRIVERIRKLETTIYNNKIKELDNMKTERYIELKQVKVQQPIKVIDNEINIIINSINVLKQWSNENTFNILFDSKVNGNGWKNVLFNRVFNKSNLYFIHLDGNNNIFGGYVSVNITKSDVWITDDNSFVFSLIRYGKVKNTKYPIISNFSNKAFYFWNKNEKGWLYQFGFDVSVNRIGDNESFCQCCYYNYNNEQNPLINTTNSRYFEAKRIIVIEIN